MKLSDLEFLDQFVLGDGEDATTLYINLGSVGADMDCHVSVLKITPRGPRFSHFINAADSIRVKRVKIKTIEYQSCDIGIIDVES